jgi:hypothetical protein
MAPVLRRLALVLLLAAAVGCSSELGRLTFSGPGKAECTIQLDGPAELSFATDLEVEGPQNLDQVENDYRYAIDAHRGPEVVASTECDPLHVGPSLIRSRSSSNTRIGAFRHSFTSARLLDCTLGVPTGGQTVLRVALVADRTSQADIINAVLIAKR